jgi:hypothetical protein
MNPTALDSDLVRQPPVIVIGAGGHAGGLLQTLSLDRPVLFARRTGTG